MRSLPAREPSPPSVSKDVLVIPLLLQDRRCNNMAVKSRVGRLLGRCHAAMNEHTLSVSALEAALDATQTSELLLSEVSERSMHVRFTSSHSHSRLHQALTVRERGRVGKASDGVAPHWGEETSKQRLAEVMGRMDEEGGGAALLEKLLLGP